MILRPAPLPSKVCDTLSHITSTQAGGLRADGFDVIMLYCGFVTREDLDACLGAGLCVGFVLEGLAATTVPTALLGHTIAVSGYTHLRQLGVPEGVVIFGDLEGPPDASHPSEAWIEFANAQADATVAGGYIAGHYVGAGLGLTSAQIYALHGTRYWKSGSRVPEPECGFCAVQGQPFDYQHPCGLKIDVGGAWLDYRGRGLVVVGA